MNARERARKAAGSKVMNYVGHAEIGADAASDVWEPLVRELLVLIEGELTNARDYSIVRYAREAIGHRGHAMSATQPEPQVVDLMEALEKSLAEAKAARSNSRYPNPCGVLLGQKKGPGPGLFVCCQNERPCPDHPAQSDSIEEAP